MIHSPDEAGLTEFKNVLGFLLYVKVATQWRRAALIALVIGFVAHSVSAKSE